MKKIITIGGATQDIFIHHEAVDFAHLTSCKIEVSGLHRATGGGATNSAVSFKQIGFDVTTFFKVGNDYAGNAVIADLKQAGIHLEHIIQTSGAPTATSFVIRHTEECIVFVYRGANMTITEEEIPYQAFEEKDCAYITSLSGLSASLLPKICNTLQAKNITIAVNPGAGQLKFGATALLNSLPSIDVFILNKNEAEKLWDVCACTQKNIPFSLEKYCMMIMQRGPQIVVVTDGPRGVYVAHKNTLYFHESIATKITNTVGAGDAFGSTFFACLQLGISLKEALLYGLINSSSVLSSSDAKAGLLYFDDLQHKVHEIGINGIKESTLE